MKLLRITLAPLAISGMVIGGIVAAPAAQATTTSYCMSVMNKYNLSESTALWCQLQGGPANFGGYKGPVDGAPGINTWKGLQTWLARYGYGGPIDGVPGTNTYKALQRWAQTGGYQGPIDGQMGPNSWAGIGNAVKIQFFTD